MTDKEFKDKASRLWGGFNRGGITHETFSLKLSKLYDKAEKEERAQNMLEYRRSRKGK